ncbi:MAG: FAD-dependent oxidoreductase [Lawsonibacter sp.]|jgi:NADPH-dependent 2,4-dienoyl-CoA reductase/sulfur reductase-like enzyme/rhodanese-related sulfurtransferase
MRVLIVGGVAAGASAAARIRRLDETAEIVLFERGPHISFANCGLPYYVGGVIKEESKILVQTPESMKDRFQIDVRVDSEVLSINAEKKCIQVRHQGACVTEPYDALVLAPGAKPFVPPVPGVTLPQIIYMRNVEDANLMKIKAARAKRAVVIGGGFIGIETAENLVEMGLEVVLVEAAPHILAPFDSDMSPILEKEMEEHGVKIILNNGLSAFSQNGEELKITLSDGQELATDFCLLSVGVRPDTKWLEESGLEMNERGFILTDEHMRTNLPDVYAAGDAVATKNLVTGKRIPIQLAGPANRQGRIAADNIMGYTSRYKGSLGTSVIKVFSLAGAATGANERTLKGEGIPYQVAELHPKNHADYYPGACNMDIKVLYGEGGRIFGAQCVAAQGADKFIDVIASVMILGGKMSDLEDLELAYAPAFLSAKSPANYAGFIASNKARGLLEEVPGNYLDEMNENTVVLDVRKDDEVANAPLTGAIHIPVNDLRARMGELEPYREKTILTLCATGVRSYIAYRMLKQHGFKVMSVRGGFRGYQAPRFQPSN